MSTHQIVMSIGNRPMWSWMGVDLLLVVHTMGQGMPETSACLPHWKNDNRTGKWLVDRHKL